jgi:acetyltransferase-like isoleucine patch superfamily enzyme
VDGAFRRTLPFGDYVVDRWERARTLGFGEGSSVYDSCLVLGDVRIGADTWVGPFTVLDGSGGLEIGAGSTISAGAQIYTHESLSRTLSGGEEEIVRRPTRIGSRVYLGPNVVVAMGVTIGDGAVVGANSFVREDVPANARAMGNPCRIVEAEQPDRRPDHGQAM